ncbi:MAG: DUF3014 domain-containing protein [Acidobacteria bacterium]|nr:DUF3014 domain-containing protein [Acidobacteriota bacterium]
MEFEPDEQPLERTPSADYGGGPSHVGPPLVPIAIGGALIVALLAAGAWWRWREPPATTTTPAAVTATEVPITAPPPPVALPPLDDMDAFLRPLLQALSNRPELVRWLATDDLVRQLAAAIDQASQGDNPSIGFKELAPRSRMAVSRRNHRRLIDPASYRRYDGLVATVTSIDASAVARIYKTIRPRLNEAYQNMGHPGGDVDAAVQQALDLLLNTPVVKGPVILVEGSGARWAYEDDNLEGLRPTQKQLVRMGPAHTDAMLVWLRALRAGLEA